MTDEKTRALIAEAERRTSEWSDPAAMPSDVKLIGSLADALSALTVPDGDARERTRGIKEEIYDLICESASVEEAAEVILAAFPALSRDIAGEIEAEIEWNEARAISDYLRGLRRAAEIARDGR